MVAPVRWRHQPAGQGGLPTPVLIGLASVVMLVATFFLFALLASNELRRMGPHVEVLVILGFHVVAGICLGVPLVLKARAHAP